MSLLWSLQIYLLMDPASKTKGTNLFSGLQLHLLQHLNHIMAFYVAWSSRELLWRGNLFKLCPHGQCSWFSWRSHCQLCLALSGSFRRFLQRFLQGTYQLILVLPLWQHKRVNCQHLTKHLTSLATKFIIFFLTGFWGLPIAVVLSKTIWKCCKNHSSPHTLAVCAWNQLS